MVGSTGDAVTFSFNGNKVLTCGGGGMVVTDDPTIAKNIALQEATALVSMTIKCRAITIRCLTPLQV